MKKIIVALLMWSSANTVYAQIKLSGVVLDSATSTPLSSAYVRLGEEQQWTNDKGYFEFTDLSAGHSLLEIRHVGCDPVVLKLELEQDSFIQLLMQHHVHHFETVRSYGKRNRESGITHSISTSTIEHQVANNLGDIVDQMPGVSMLKTGNSIGKPIIQGMHSNRIAIIQGENRLESQQWGAEHAPEVDPLSAGSVELIKGAASLIYAYDAPGGIIRLLPSPFADSNYQNFVLLAKTELFSLNSGLIGFKWEKYRAENKLGQRLNFSYKGAGDAFSPDYILANTAYRQMSGAYLLQKSLPASTLTLQVSALLHNLGILSASHIGNLTDLQQALSSDTPLISREFSFNIESPYQNVMHYNAKLKWEKAVPLFGDISLIFQSQYNRRREFDRHSNNDQAALDLRLLTQQFNAYANKHKGKHWQYRYGMNSELQDNLYTGRYFIPNYRRNKSGLYYVSTWESSKSQLEGGLRYDFIHISTYRWMNDVLIHEPFNFNNWSASLSGRHHFNEDFSLHLNSGSKFRAPDINELFSGGLHHGAAALEYGNTGLQAERSYSISSGLIYNHNRWQITAEPYVHYISNFIYLQPTGRTQLSIRGAFPVFEFQQTNARLAGSDMGIAYIPRQNWQISASSSLLYAKDIKNGTYIYGMAPQRFQFELKKLTDKFISMENLSWRLSASYTMEQNRVEEGQDFALPPPAWFLVNAELSAKQKDYPLHYHIRIGNLFNSRYRDYLNRYRYYTDDLGRNISLSINYTF